MKLPESQVAVLEAASANDEQTIAELAEETGLKPETVTGAVFELEDEGLLSIDERTEESVSLTEEGEEYAEDGLPEIALYEAAIDAGADDDAVQMGQPIGGSGLGGPQVNIALSNYARKGYGSIDSGEITVDPDANPDEDDEASALAALADGESVDDADTLDQLESRGLVERSESTVRSVTLTEAGVTAMMEGIEAAETVGQLTPEMLTTGDWRDVEFAEYNVAADAERVDGGKVHILRQTANRVKDVLVGMGFEEMDGPHADADFWINDCLFMPQDHPARTHWDRFALSNPTEIGDLPEDLVERVHSAHLEGVGENGEGYHSPWDEDFARAIALRGHTTSLSMRYLSGYAQGELEPPQRFFSVEKVYRNDTLDPTHLLEFFQIEGWVMAEDLSVRDLMGTFEEFYAQFGITDIQFKPHYNPYTEPSFELFGNHPETGELIEIGNSGMFRPEVLEPLGVECDVMAWGLALERLLMLMYGFEDIRDVHGTLCDLELLRDVEVIH
ncbi:MULTISPECIES: phenylalanine--tRNA ligase subunit alpha [unclassified Haladaptatus]|uniref:phenylalanine--tRNA ligase subunit alpha n=1 Tax=unclassified Haladaptatus TaxID=2622732 RepID=UPI00209C1551|nr:MULTISPECIES: phenylalanine--tRNA ligase subunit alpha [unclassified Haladaptatus]MCO8242429.1 phenylalanine--tRNA ligase subunit alpha [Haladaptatus sp. AB643]MCO8252187.1 phenylalanine--tRNA ligase subunit alpha [Haladaptatus sp. AB618]